MDQFGLQSVEYYYKIKYNKNNLRQNKFTFQTVQSSAMWKFWKDRAEMLANLQTQICSLFTELSHIKKPM